MDYSCYSRCSYYKKLYKYEKDIIFIVCYFNFGRLC